MCSLTDLCPLITVSSLPMVGRCALAARDIEAGEVVMEDEAVMVSPGGGRRVCLECGAGLAEEEEEVSCTQCGLPVCCAGQGARLGRIVGHLICGHFNGHSKFYLTFHEIDLQM